jgi:hypothetical protein
LESELKRIGDLLEEMVGILREKQATAKTRRPLTTAELEQRRAAARSRYTPASTEPHGVRTATAGGTAVARTSGTASALPAVRHVAVETGRAGGKNTVHHLIGAYIRAWQARYRTNARPDVTPAIGVFRKLLKERSAEELSQLVQVYCQMDDKWFQTKHHDIGTFGANVGKVAVAREKGHERPNGERHWMEIHEERSK